MAEAAIITEPTELQLCMAHKGFVWLEIESRFRSRSRPLWCRGRPGFEFNSRFPSRHVKASNPGFDGGAAVRVAFRRLWRPGRDTKAPAGSCERLCGPSKRLSPQGRGFGRSAEGMALEGGRRERLVDPVNWTQSGFLGVSISMVETRSIGSRACLEGGGTAIRSARPRHLSVLPHEARVVWEWGNGAAAHGQRICWRSLLGDQGPGPCVALNGNDQLHPRSAWVWREVHESAGRGRGLHLASRGCG